MPVEKLSVSLPDSLARRIDDLARDDGVSRSALIQEAAAQYVASRDAASTARRRRSDIDAALVALDGIAATWGADSRTGIEYLAAIRGESDPVDVPVGDDERG